VFLSVHSADRPNRGRRGRSRYSHGDGRDSSVRSEGPGVKVLCSPVFVETKAMVRARVRALAAIEAWTDAAAKSDRHRQIRIGNVVSVGIDHLGGVADVAA
jgi:hypothetical protein